MKAAILYGTVLLMLLVNPSCVFDAKNGNEAWHHACAPSAVGARGSSFDALLCAKDIFFVELILSIVRRRSLRSKCRRSVCSYILNLVHIGVHAVQTTKYHPLYFEGS